MSRDEYNNRLESLFSDPEPATPRQSGHDQSLPGWTWECDVQGDFIACSPEIEQVLGFRPEDVIGKPLFNFALAADSASALQATLEMGDLPIDQEVRYQTRDGASIPISLHIFDISYGDKQRWGGFAQAQFIPNTGGSPHVSAAIGTPTVPGAASWQALPLWPFNFHKDLQSQMDEVDKQNGKDQAAQQGEVESHAQTAEIHKPDHLLAGEVLLKILEDMRLNSGEVNQYPYSQLNTRQKEELREDRSRKPRVTGRLGGVDIHAYPKVVYQRIEYRLEWGNKLDITPGDEDFIKQFKYRPSGWSGFIKTRLAPKEILKADKYWIAVCIEMVDGKSKHVWVDYDRQENDFERLDLQAFIQDSKVILPILDQALKNPWKSHSTLRIGEDYLIPQ